MAIEFLSSCGDNIATADLLAEWTSLTGTPAVNASGGRRSSGGIELSSESITKGVPGTATKIVGVAFKIAGLTTVTDVIQLKEAAAIHIELNVGVTGAIEVNRGTTTVLGTSSAGLITAGAYNYIELKAVISETVGTIDVKLNGVNVTGLTGLTGLDTQTGATGVVNGVTFKGNADLLTIDDVYIDDTNFLGDLECSDILPDGDGNKTQFTTTFPASPTTHYTSVNEASPDDDTSYNESATANHIDLFTYDDLTALAGGSTVLGVQVKAYTKKDDAGARSIRNKVRISGTDYNGTTQAISTSYVYYQDVFELDPDTGMAWLEAAINAAEFGYEVI